MELQSSLFLVGLGGSISKLQSFLWLGSIVQASCAAKDGLKSWLFSGGWEVTDMGPAEGHLCLFPGTSHRSQLGPLAFGL